MHAVITRAGGFTFSLINTSGRVNPLYPGQLSINLFPDPLSATAVHYKGARSRYFFSTDQMVIELTKI